MFGGKPVFYELNSKGVNSISLMQEMRAWPWREECKFIFIKTAFYA